MPTFTYNDMTFTVAPCDDRWDLSYARPNCSSATVGTGLFAGLAEAEATARALASSRWAPTSPTPTPSGI